MTEPIYEAQDMVIQFANDTAESIIIYVNGLKVYYPEEAPPPSVLSLFWLLATAYLALFFYLYLHY